MVRWCGGEVVAGGGGGGYGGGGGGPSTSQNAAAIEAQLHDIAGQLGVPQQDWSGIAWEAASNNWSAAMVRDHVANMISLETLKADGLGKTVANRVRDTAAQYYVTVSDDEVLNFARRIAGEDMDEQAILGFVRDRAKGQYYWLSDVIDQGTTLKEYFQPHQDTIAKLLEVSPSSVDFMNDERWQNVMRKPPEQPGGEERAMNLFETAKYVRGLEEWKKTSNARSTSATAVSALGRVLGRL